MPSRGPKIISAGQQKFLGDRMARQPVKATKPAAVKPNPFSASTTPLQSASLTPGMSASGAGAIPTASTPGASSSPTSLGMTPTASAGGYSQGGNVQSFAMGGIPDTTSLATTTNTNPAGAYTQSVNTANPMATAGGYSEGGQIADPKEEPYRNKWKAKNHPGDTSYKFEDGGSAPGSDPDMARARQTTGRGAFKEAMKNDQATRKAFPTGQSTGQQQEEDAQSIADYVRSGGQEGKGDTSSLDYDSGGGIPDPAVPLDAEQGQEGQAGDLGPALAAVQNAFQYGRQQLMGGQGQPAGQINQSRGGSVPSLQDGGIVDARNMTPSKEGIKSVTPGQSTSESLRQNVPKLADGGVMPPPAAPQPQQPTPAPAGGGVSGSPPPQIMRYLTGADAAPIPQVLQRMNSMRGPGGAAKAVASGRTPQEQYAIMQGLRKLSNAAGAHAKASLQGNAQVPASLNHAVMFANKKFEYTPAGKHITFSLKGQKTPTQNTATGGLIQSFDDGGQVDPAQQFGSVGMPTDAPIDMTVQDLTNGQTTNTPLSLQDFDAALGKGYDSAVQFLNQGFGSPSASAQPTAGRTYTTEPIPGSTLPERADKAVTGAIQSNIANPIVDTAKSIADWLSGRQTAPTYHAENQPNLPAGTPYATPTPVKDVQTSALGPPTEGDVKGKNWDEQNTWVQARQGQPGITRRIPTLGPNEVPGSDFDTASQAPSQQGAIPYKTAGGTPGITPGAPSGGPPNAGVTPPGGNPQRKITIYRGMTPTTYPVRSPDENEPSTAEGQPSAATGTPTARKPKQKISEATPDMVYGRGKDGRVGTWRKLPNGQALYLSAEDMTGGSTAEG